MLQTAIQNAVNPYIIPGIQQQCKVEIILQVCCQQASDFFCETLTPEIVRGKSQKREICTTRQLAMYYIWRGRTGMSEAKIGIYFNYRDHATVNYAKKTIKNLSETDPDIRLLMRKIESHL